MDEICRAFEAASVVILDRNCKSVIPGLRSWMDGHGLQLAWLQIASSVKAFGALFTSTYV